MTKLVCLLAAFLSFATFAQSDSTDRAARRQAALSKRVAKPHAPTARLVDGKQYDPSTNPLWEGFEGEILKVLTNGVVLQRIEVRQVYARRRATAAQRIGAYAPEPTPIEERVPGKKVFVRNYPLSIDVTTGAKARGYAMRVGVFDYDGDRLELWDCGTPPQATDSATTAELLKPRVKANLERVGSDLVVHNAGREDWPSLTVLISGAATEAYQTTIPALKA